LSQAVSVALEKNPLRKAALAETHASSAGVRVAQSSLFPRLSFSETATRGNDPVYVFGSRLRQQRFTDADFALNKLNTPLPLGNFATRFGGAWTMFDSFASWHGIARAKLMNEAALHELDRTEQEIVFRVVTTYYEVLLTNKQLEVSEQSARTAQAIVDRSQARFDSGLTVESDLLTAKVRLARRRQEVIRSSNSLNLARAHLNTAMGVPIDSFFELSDATTERALSIPALQDMESQALASRPDLKGIASMEAAQQQSVAMAKASFGPQINAFAGWEMDNPTFLGGGGGNNWLGGVEVKMDIFQGGARRAEVSRQRALEEKAASLKRAASDAIRLEVRHAYYDTDSNRQQVELARGAIAEAQESLRINQNRYESGLTTITDLLGAEESAHRSQTDYWEAVYRFRTSYANLELASGTLNAQSPVVQP
jgi:outer membrane protein TolC